MSEKVMWIPMEQALCVDLIRFGGYAPDTIGELAEQQILDFLERSFDHNGPALFGDHALDFAERHLPDVADEWRSRNVVADVRKRRPMVWKEVTVENGSEVRMRYDGAYHYALVEDGSIVDEDGSFSPSEWASKIAGGTSRNAWRDLWFKTPRSTEWVPAHLLRAHARSALRELSGNTES